LPQRTQILGLSSGIGGRRDSLARRSSGSPEDRKGRKKLPAITYSDDAFAPSRACRRGASFASFAVKRLLKFTLSISDEA
jgi:hypothetical protein